MGGGGKGGRGFSAKGQCGATYGSVRGDVGGHGALGAAVAGRRRADDLDAVGRGQVAMADDANGVGGREDGQEDGGERAHLERG